MEYGLKVTITKMARDEGFALTGNFSYALIGEDDDIDFVSDYEFISEMEEFDKEMMDVEQEEFNELELIEVYDLTSEV